MSFEGCFYALSFQPGRSCCSEPRFSTAISTSSLHRCQLLGHHAPPFLNAQYFLLCCNQEC